jgi:hypoxanthine-DNA glycosylase
MTPPSRLTSQTCRTARTGSLLAKPESSSASPRKQQKTKCNNKKASVPVTTSFEPIWSGRFDDVETVLVHTLILGTHPSIKSLEEQQYFGHPMNAFWWIAGDCLGFRRASCVSPSTGKPYAMARHLRYGLDRVLSYPEQQDELVRHGFALWDVVHQCRRPGSLDQDICEEEPNALREFAQQHRRTLKRIVFANGGTGCKIFIRHFSDWLGSGELKALSGHETSEKMFAKVIEREEKKQSSKPDAAKISLVVALGVSPAAARYSYIEKRDFWEKYVYRPGLEDFHATEYL